MTEIHDSSEMDQSQTTAAPPQQVDWDAFGRTWAEYRLDPVRFVKEVLKADPEEWQKAALRDMRDARKVTVASCTGAGKTALAAWVILWFVTCFPYAIVVCTAPTKHLLKNVLWREILKWIETNPILEGMLEWKQEMIKHRFAPNRWYVVARTTTAKKAADGGEAQAEGLAGFHTENLLFVMDEASGIPDPHFNTAERTLTGGENNKILVIGNPLRITGRFFEIHKHHERKKAWKRHQVSALPRKGVQWLTDQPEKEDKMEQVRIYGADDADVMARVYGLFPTGSSSNTVLSADRVREAAMRVVTPDIMDETQIGVDCARYGEDESVITTRRGFKAMRQRVERHLDSVSLADAIEEEIILTAKESVRLLGLNDKDSSVVRRYWPRVMIDEGNIGGAVLDIMWDRGYDCCEGVNFGGEATDRLEHYDFGTEMWYWVRDLIDEIDMSEIADGEPDEELIKQLSTRRYVTVESRSFPSQKKIESKKEMKRRGLPSCDRADAFVLCFAIPPVGGIV